MSENLSEPSAKRIQSLIDKEPQGFQQSEENLVASHPKGKLSYKPTRVSFSRCLKAFSEKKTKNGRHIIRRFSSKKGALLSYASCKIPRSSSYAGKLSSSRVLRWEIKEYVFMFKKLQKNNKPSLDLHKEYNITRILFSQKNGAVFGQDKEELWEEVLRARPSLQTGKAWIDLKIKI